MTNSRTFTLQSYNVDKKHESLFIHLKFLQSATKHENLVRIVDLIQCSNTVAIIYESFSKTLSDFSKGYQSIALLKQVSYQILQAIHHFDKLHYYEFPINPNSIFHDEYKDNFKLASHLYGLPSRPRFEDLRYLPPEIIFSNFNEKTNYSIKKKQELNFRKTSIWSLGLVLIEHYLNKNILPTYTCYNEYIIFLKKLLKNCKKGKNISNQKNQILLRLRIKELANEKEIPKQFLQFISSCLIIDPLKRFTTKELLSHDFLTTNILFRSLSKNEKNHKVNININMNGDSNNIKNENENENNNGNSINLENKNENKNEDHKISNYNHKTQVDDIYYYWKCYGGRPKEILNELVLTTEFSNIVNKIPHKIKYDKKKINNKNKQFLIQINRIYPKVQFQYHYPIEENTRSTKEFSRKYLAKYLKKKLIIDQYKALLNDSPINKRKLFDFLQVQLQKQKKYKIRNQNVKGKVKEKGDEKKKEKKKEKDQDKDQDQKIDQKKQIEKEKENEKEKEKKKKKYKAKGKVQKEYGYPPFLRNKIWEIILGVTKKELEKNKQIINTFNISDLKKESKTQINKDIKRCHQYDPFLKTKTGRKQLKKILRIWCVQQTNQKISYWQGLDEICAAVLVLNPFDEVWVYSIFSKIVEKFHLKGLTESNGIKYRSTIRLFDTLVSYHLPKLKIHIYDQGVTDPISYCTPWFFTLFCHNFLLKEIHQLWDHLLIKIPSYPIFIALAIFDQLKAALVRSNFENILKKICKLPKLNIKKIIQKSQEFFSTTPPSIYYNDYLFRDFTSFLDLDNKQEKRKLNHEILNDINNLSSQFSPSISLVDTLSFFKNPLFVFVEKQIHTINNQKVRAIFLSRQIFYNEHLPRPIHQIIEKERNKPIIIISVNNIIAQMASNFFVRLKKKYVSILIN
ncbi:tbc1 domain containing kinase [Anaeramoeba flamelloides]|uniref:Tbc1 domain containing kinase n=1 Tax=Anaeramoeba flamelloides TaxID=1746091 RepID=A0AAV7Y7S9_9EUKA|nr:tbc1 domain containing kinase [Anaeramoeba flamelloides]